MFSLQKLLSRDDKFFDLLESSAEEARGSVQLLIPYLKSPDHVLSLNDFVEKRRKDKMITREISEHLCTTFVTPLEREDIESLANTLYKIPKTVEKFGERLLLAPHFARGIDFTRHAEMLTEATDSILIMVKELRSGLDLHEIKRHNTTLQRIEGEGDKLMLDALRGIYETDQDPLRTVFLKDLFELLEKIFDRCRDCGNSVFQIVLKHS
ncbi:MAG TPA: DUF47 family protein [Candidatus Acidoferrum sp.]|nr:DUF47 family protein [Candidatus Acidoferrum sp.]